MLRVGRAAVLGAVLCLLAAVVYGGLRVTYGQRSAFVHVRWADTVDAGARAAFERQFRLVPVEARDGSTWRYQLMDVSRGNIERIVTSPAVADTHYLHRTAFRVWRTAPRGAYDSPRPAWVADRAEQVMLASGVFGALLLTACGVQAIRRRRRGDTAPAPAFSMGDLEAYWAESLRAASAPLLAHRSRWLVLTALLVAPLLLALVVTMWREPFPINETVAIMEGGGVLDPAPFSLTGRQFTALFDVTASAYYRPLYFATWYGLWHAAGDVDTTLLLFRLLEVALVIAVAVLLLRELAPRTPAQAASAVFAMTVLLGMPQFRENLELPLLYTLIGMPLILLVWRMLTGPYRAWHGPAIAAALAVATGYKEQGLVIAPLVVALWWAGAPGATRGRTAAVVLLAGAYVAFRLTAGGHWAPFEQDVSIGFRRYGASEAAERFGDFPYPVYAYNALATVLNILISEPTSGQFTITSNLLRGEAEPWQWNALLSSLALTALIAWWGVRALREGTGGRPWSREAQVFAACVVTTLASGPLGFNYTRDRFGGMATVFYAMAAYHAMHHLLAWLVVPSRSPRTVLRMTAAALVLAAAWQLRAIGTVESEHARTNSSRREWMADLQPERVDKAEKTRYVAVLDALARQGRDLDSSIAGRYPSWAIRWLK